ncbi:DUF3160 domain-containing protein [Porphyromonas sp.]|uniref:DUF3160 domain-containing protein n=1 Tax=Porphyromonas sp. TaxID=1924944 RepID=UPI0026DC1FAD|nr:DUF3160 domain-containing protein [Porphyromonas sp.]MDO4770648.1 DUF3160 domain-containing protein [Porphyromonas sp.]
MKKFVTYFCLILLVFWSCTGGKKGKGEENNRQIDKAVNFLSEEILPRSVDINQDIQDYSLQELRLLKAYVYAIHGLFFMEADINAYFTNNTDWYGLLTEQLFNESEEKQTEFATEYHQIKLSPEETEFVTKIEARIKELQAQQMTDQGGYKLGNPEMTANLFQFKDVDSTLIAKLKECNFAIGYGGYEQLFHLYEENDYRKIPSFVTSDLYLQAMHMYFSYVMKSLEQEHFIPTMKEIALAMYKEATKTSEESTDEKIKDIALHTATFYAIPYYILTQKEVALPEKYQRLFKAEVTNIMKEEPESSEFLETGSLTFPYDLFKPRGHYTRKDETRAYFKAMMWLQVAYFCRDDVKQLERAIFQAHLLRKAKTAKGISVMQEYNKVYEQITFLTGTSDNLSLMDVVDVMRQKSIGSLSDALSNSGIEKISVALASIAESKNVIKPKIERTCRDKINFMPQRYLPDNEVLQSLVDPQPNSVRAYPKGLDIFAANGIKQAEDILFNLYKEDKNWDEYAQELDLLKNKFRSFKPAYMSLYDLWLNSLFAMNNVSKEAPSFMQTPQWGYKNLNTALASWAELKHDAILYGEQPMTAECGGGGLPTPDVVGYVEPNMPLWEKMREITDTAVTLLRKHGCLTPDLESKSENLAAQLDFLISVTKKELTGRHLTSEELNSISIIGSSVELFTLSVLDPGTSLDNWQLVEGPDKSIAVVADVYTRNVLGCDKQGVLHVGTGTGNPIFVLVEINGYLYLTRGAVLSYYEFVRPLDERLSDEEWQEMLKNGNAPSVPEWIQKVMIGKTPKSDDRVFYSSGC